MFFPNTHMAPMAQFPPMAMHSAAPFAQGMAQMAHAHTGAMGAAGSLARPTGGLLGRLLGGLKAGGGGQSLNLMSILQNTQRVVGMVQTVTPMVQQYGPIIRNLPALYKIMKSTPSSDSNVENANTTNAVEKPVDDTISSIPSEQLNREDPQNVTVEQSNSVTNKPVQKPKRKQEPISQKKFIPRPIKGIPGPKMYI